MKVSRNIRNRIMVVLVGDTDKKLEVLNELGDKFYEQFDPNQDYVLFNDDIEIWHLIGGERVNCVTLTNFKEADAVIYLNKNSPFQNEFEKRREPNKCIAIDFETVKLNFKDCLEKIENYIDFPQNIEEESKKKSMLVLQGNKVNPSSIFHTIPQELSMLIAGQVYSLTNANRDGFFSSPLEKIQKPFPKESEVSNYCSIQ